MKEFILVQTELNKLALLFSTLKQTYDKPKTNLVVPNAVAPSHLFWDYYNMWVPHPTWIVILFIVMIQLGEGHEQMAQIMVFQIRWVKET